MSAVPTPTKLLCRGTECRKINPSGVVKNRARFGRDLRMTNGRRDICLVCERADTKARRENNPEGAIGRSVNGPEVDKPLMLAAGAAERIFAELVAEAPHNMSAAHTLKPEAFNAVIAQRRDLYAISGMDALYDLAMMAQTDNSMMMQVKLLAAKALIALRSDEDGGKDGKPLDNMLAALNNEFHKYAPKIKAVRQTTTEMIVDGGGEKIVN